VQQQQVAGKKVFHRLAVSKLALAISVCCWTEVVHAQTGPDFLAVQCSSSSGNRSHCQEFVQKQCEILSRVWGAEVKHAMSNPNYQINMDFGDISNMVGLMLAVNNTLDVMKKRPEIVPDLFSLIVSGQWASSCTDIATSYYLMQKQ